MSRELRQSTAQTEGIGPFLDATDGVTEETALGSPPSEIKKDGGAFGTGPTGTHDAEGWYDVTFTTANTDTLGSLIIKSQDSTTHLPVWHEFMVITANEYDSKYGTDIKQADVTQILGDATSAIDLKDFADAGYDPATNKVQGVVLVDTTTANTDMRGTDSAALASVCTELRLAELDPANIPAEVDKIALADAGAGVAGSLAEEIQNRDAIATAILDLANGVETGLTLRQSQRIIASATAAKVSGADTTTMLFRNAVADSKNRLTVTVDLPGNRSAIAYDLT